MKSNLIITEDGSSSIYVPEIDETYHSTHGAIQESTHVFINSGLSCVSKQNLRILEIGFGTGLNALLSYIYGKVNGKIIQYHTIEKFPLSEDVYCHLNYGNILHEVDVFTAIHKANWGLSVSLSNQFELLKQNVDVAEYLPDGCFDVVYYDAFSPDKQPEMWQVDIFEKLFHSMNPCGTLVTYCAKGEVRRRMQAAGFTVERIPGPIGKREMLRAVK